MDWNGKFVQNAVVIARGMFRGGHAKTAHGLILHGRIFRIVAVIDQTCAGQDAGELMGIGKRGIPVVASLDEIPGAGGRVPGAGSRTRGRGVHRRPSSLPGPRPPAPGTRYPDPGTLIIGVAPAGGRLPGEWRKDIKEAIGRGMDIVSGLHDFLGDDPELASMAKRSGARIWDVRRPPERLELFSGRKWPVPVVLTCGTDASSGKRTVTAELYNAARSRGIGAAIVATGQTGMMVGADEGVAIDHVPGDFMSGTVEDMVHKVMVKGAELVFVQGQASLTHQAYGPVTLGILFGARPHYVVMVHVPGRDFRPSFPDQPVNGPMEEYALVRMLSGAKAVGIALDCRKCADPAAVIRECERASGIPAADVLRDGPGKLLDSLLRRLAGDGRFRFGPGLRKAIGAVGKETANHHSRQKRSGSQ